MKDHKCFCWFVGSFLLLFLLSGSVWAQQKEPIAVVRTIKGMLEVKPKDNKNWTIAMLGMVLYDGDKIRTRANSRAFILFTDGTQIKINAETILTVEGKKEKRTLMKKIGMSVGEIWSKVTKGKDSHLEIETPTSVASVKGTEFYLLVDDNGTMLLVIDGLLLFGNDINEILVPAGNEAEAGEDTPPVIVEIDEAQMDSLQEWAEEFEPELRLQLQLQGDSPTVNRPFELRVEIQDNETGEIDTDFAQPVNVVSNSQTMEFRVGAASWTNSLEITLENGARLIQARDSAAGQRRISVVSEGDVNSALLTVQVAPSDDAEPEPAPETGEMIIQYVDEDGNTQNLRIQYRVSQ